MLGKHFSTKKLVIPLSVLILILSFITISLELRGYFQKKKPSSEVLAERAILDDKANLKYSQSTQSAKPIEKKVLSDSISNVGKISQSSVSQLNSSKAYLGFAFESRSSSRIVQVEEQIGRSFDLLMTYTQWGNPPNSVIDSNFFAFFNSNSKIPIISWEPWDPSRGVDQSVYKLSNIANGNFDNYIRNSARAIKNYGKVVFLRFAHEMNGNWYPWGGTVNLNSANDYIGAYRHIHDLFSQEAVGNVTWIWSPDTWSFPNFNGNDIADYYPGDNYVDWVGLDGYNFGDTKSGQVWKSFTDLFSSGYSKVVGYNKPIMIAETASAESGGNKGEWIRQAFTNEIPKNFPKVKALIWFNINKEADWDINSSSNSISQFRKVVSTDYYKPTVRVSNSKIISP